MNAEGLSFNVPMSGETDANYGGDLLRIFWRNKWLIAAVVVLVTTCAVIYTLVVPPLYKSTASMIVATSSVSRQGADVDLSPGQDDTLVANQSEILSSRAVARDVVQRLGLADDLEFNPKADPHVAATTTPATIENATDALQKLIEVHRVGRSAIITVTVASTSREKAARIANKIVDEHIALQALEKAKASETTATALRPQVDMLRQRLIAADNAAQNYRRAHNIVGPTATPDLSELGKLTGTLADARTSRTEAAARAGAADPAARGATSATSPLLNDLRRQSAELGKRVAELSTYYGAGYPDLINAKAQLADVDRRIGEESSRVARELGTEVAIGRAREGQISSDLGRLRGQSFQDQAASVRLLDLEREADATRAIYVDLLTRLRQVEGQGPLYRIPAKMFARAVTPTIPAFPRRKEIVGVAAIASFVLGLILAYLTEQIRERRIRTGEQVERLIGLPTLAMVPFVPDGAGSAIYRNLIRNPGSVFSEAARSLYLEVRQLLPANGSHVVLLTSPLPGEGKTTLALSLGAAAAVQWRRAVVVDLDLRRPGLLEIIGHSRQGPDLVAYLNGNAEIDEIVVSDPAIRNLSVVGVNRRPDDPAALLATPRLGDLIDELRTRFDVVVVNAPPLLAVRDAKTFASFADATLLVLRWGRSHADAVRAAARSFGRSFTGAVINQVDFDKHARSAHRDAVQHHSACSSYYFNAPPSEQRVNG